MEEDNLQPQKPLEQNNTPANLPGVEVTDPNETTQQISPKTSPSQTLSQIPPQTPAQNLQQEAQQTDLQKEVNNNLKEVIKPELASEEKEQVVSEKASPKLVSPELKPEEADKLKSLRTYKGDLEQVMTTEKGSLVGIASAESERRHKIGRTKPVAIEDNKESEKKFAKKVGIIILSTVLIVLGIGLIFYFYGKSNPDTITPDSQVSSIIFADEDFEFNITNLSRRQILNELTSIKDRTKLSVGRIRNIFITESLIDEEGFERKALVSAGDFLNAIDVNIPTSFLRSLQPNFMLGIHVFDGNQPFLILKTSFYENAFVGMLEWETNIKDNLSPLFNSGEKVSTENATSTLGFSSLIFSDLIIKNKDTRVLKNENGEAFLIYSFIDRQTILITTNENTFGEVFTRLTSSRTLR